MAHMFTGTSNVTISGGTFVNQTYLENSALDKLSVAAAHSALHDAPARTDQSRCHQYTRTNVLRELEHWIQGIFDGGGSIFWLYGGAGVGKSAIMQTLAERCAAQGLALGSFFFSRGDPTRNTAEVLIPTLVYQLVQIFPSALQVLNPIIDRDPLIFKKSFQVQLLSLFVRSIQHLEHLGVISDAPQSPRVFLIDGLDECDDPIQQQAIIQAAALVCHENRLPVKFLIASRPELAISTSFRWYKQKNHILGTISLSEDTDAEADIRQFVEDQFLKIRTQHSFNYMIPSGWPHLYDINRLVGKSSSHFIYASTVMKYIWSAKESPVRSLQVVLGLEVSRTVSPFLELDALYHHILKSAAHRDKVLQILAHRLFIYESASASMVCIMLDCSKDDLFIFMADMIPLVVLTKSSLAHKELQVTFLHASLGDFLCDQSRSGPLYLNKRVYLVSKLDRCFQLFNLYSKQRRTVPDWPAESMNTTYFWLKSRIITTIKKSSHLVATQEVLRRYSLRDFHKCQLRFQNFHHELKSHDLSNDLIQFLCAVHAIKTSDGLMLLTNYLEDFFDIVESNICSESKSLGPAILPLIFSEYSAQAICEIHSYHSRGNRSYGLIAEPFFDESRGILTILDVITTADLASTRQSVETSPKHLAIAAEAILGYLVHEVKARSSCSSTYSVHRSWLHRTKPGKYIATGAPRLASVLYARLFGTLAPLEEPANIGRFPENFPISKRLSMELRYCLSVHEMRRLQEKLVMVATLVDALLWVLPKAAFSEKIVIYSNKRLPWIMYKYKSSLCRLVRKSLDKYNARVQIENGDNVVIEKSCML